MPAYALAHLRPRQMDPEVFEYIERIQATLDPFGGRFLVHGGRLDVLEGAWPGDVVLIEFPDMEQARAWYDSPAYQEILPMRTAHFDGDVTLVEGVPAGYDPVTKVAQLRARTAE